MDKEYYRIIKGFTISIQMGFRSSNCYYGSSNILEPIYKSYNLFIDESILVTNNNVFYMYNGKWVIIYMDPPIFSPLENKSNKGNGFNKFPKECLIKVNKGSK